MNKEDFLSSLEGRFAKVIKPKLREELNDVNKYDLAIVHNNGRVQVAPLVVIDEGTDNEEAFAPDLTEPAGKTTFNVQVEAYLDAQVKAGKFIKAILTSVDDANGIAKAVTYKKGIVSLLTVFPTQQILYIADSKIVMNKFSPTGEVV